MHVKGWVKSTLLDYPEKIAASLFCGGCNFRCPNCHNSDIVLHPDHKPDLSEDEIWEFLDRRRGLLDGIVISGGEPTLQPDLASFAARARELGFLVKLDTNGYRPDVLDEMIDACLVDYVAMDVKAPLEKYALAAGVPVNRSRIQHSVQSLLQGRVPYEFRTTVVPGLLVEEDILEIARWISGAVRFCLQQFVPRNTLDPQMMERDPYPPRRLRAMAVQCYPWVQEVCLRGI